MSIAVPTNTVITAEQPADHAAIDLLSILAFGPGRYARSAFRVREQAEHDPRLSLVARIEDIVAVDKGERVAGHGFE